MPSEAALNQNYIEGICKFNSYSLWIQRHKDKRDAFGPKMSLAKKTEGSILYKMRRSIEGILNSPGTFKSVYGDDFREEKVRKSKQK